MIKTMLVRCPNIKYFSLCWWFINLLTCFLNNSKILHKSSLFIIGMFIHTFIEYFTHYYICHGPLWIIHKKHHHNPGSTRHLTTPLFYSLGITFSAFYIYYICFSLNIAYGLINGQTFMYIMFEYIHYISHHSHKSFKIIKNNEYIQFLNRCHKKHHYEGNEHYNEYYNYGFTTLFWDRIFGTYLE